MLAPYIGYGFQGVMIQSEGELESPISDFYSLIFRVLYWSAEAVLH